MFRKEVGLNRWLNVSGVTWANWLPRSLCSETLAIFSWQQPHAGACTFASKHIGRLDSKNMQKWYHLKNRFGKSIKKTTDQLPPIKGHWIMMNHASFLVTSGPVYPISILELSGDMEWAGTAQWPGKNIPVSLLEKSQVFQQHPTINLLKLGRVRDLWPISGTSVALYVAYVTRVVFWNPTRLNLGTSSMMWQTGPAAQTFWCSQSAGRLSALDFPGNMWLLESIWEHLKTL